MSLGGEVEERGSERRAFEYLHYRITRSIMNKLKICLIHTGGTIGMIREHKGESYILRSPEDPSGFLRHLKVEEEIREIADLEFVDLLNKDSTNMVPADWTKTARAIHERMDRGYRGFVITHGTDTMHFTASALAFALGPEIPCPVVLTGAQTTSDVLHGDARINLTRAIKVALSEVAEVVISFDRHIFRGCRTQKSNARSFSAFVSPAIPPLGEIAETILLDPSARRRPDTEGKRPVDFYPDFASGVFPITLTPGLEPGLLLPVIRSPACSALVIRVFGAGNMPDIPEYSFENIIRTATHMGTPVILASQLPAGSALQADYALGIKPGDGGSIPVGNMTNASVMVKTRWVLARVDHEISRQALDRNDRLDRIEQLMTRPYVGEMD